MVARNKNVRVSKRNLWAAGPLTAAAVFMLAGQAAAQSGAGKAPAAQPSGQPAAQPAKNPGTGKLIKSASDTKGQPEMRNPLQNAAPESGSEKVKVDEHLIVDLHVNDEDLSNVLQMLSIQSQKNIVTSKNVAAVVTANLYGVTFYEALDAILHVNGYGYIERGNFIYVYTLDELKTIEEQQRHQVWKVVKLNYLNATDAAEFVKPLLSEHGQIKTNGKAPAYTIAENAPTGGEEFAHESTMMVFDFEENLSEIEKVVKELDTRPSQVLVEATILQTQLNEANAFGIDFSIIGDLDFSDFVNLGGPLRAVDGLINGSSSGGSSGGSGSGGSGSGGSGSGGSGSGSSGGTPLPSDGRGGAIVSTAGNTAGPATLKMGLVYNDVSAFLRILDEVSDTTIISRPNILTLNRQSARVLVGRKVGYLNTTSTDTTSTQTVEFLDTGTQLYFRPFIAADGTIRMELKPKVSEAVIRNVTNSGGAAVTIPDEISNELTTNVMCKDGQTIVLGGLFRENTSASRRQVPGVGDLPIIGAAFRGHEDSTQRSEIIFMITPTIVNDQVLTDEGERGEAMVDRVRTGSRQQLLPWSREKRTQQLVVQATELMAQGKRDEALYKIQRALSLSPNQPDAIEIREGLMNQKASWPTRSMQHEIITNEIGKDIADMPKSSGQAPAPAPAKMFSIKSTQPKPAPAPEPVAVEVNGQVMAEEPVKDANLSFTNTQVEPGPVVQPAAVEPAPAPKAEPKPAPKAEPKPEMKPAPKAEPKPEAKPAPKAEPKSEVKPVPRAEPKPEPKPEPTNEPGVEPVYDPSAEPATEPGNDPEPAAEPSTEPTDPGTEPGNDPQASAKLNPADYALITPPTQGSVVSAALSTGRSGHVAGGRSMLIMNRTTGKTGNTAPQRLSSAANPSIHTR